MTLREKCISAMEDAPFIDDAYLQGTTQQRMRFEHYADVIASIILAEAAGAIRAEFRPGGQYGIAYADMAETFVAAIEQLGER